MGAEKGKHFRIGSRKSQLAMIQSEWVIKQLESIYSTQKYTFNIVGISTTGDKILDVALSKIGEKSLFTKELEVALLDNEIDFVVHSLKDLPTQLPDGLSIAAIAKREDPRDAVLFSPKFQGESLATLPLGSTIGTSSLRRVAQLKLNFPHLNFIDVRGNLNTRLNKLNDPKGPYAALILAAAGVKRMGWEDKIGQFLESAECMHAVGQGALPVECTSENLEVLELLQPLNDPSTYMCCMAERNFLRTLEGGCSVPVAVSTSVTTSENENSNVLKINGGVWNLDGSMTVSHEMDVDLNQEDAQFSQTLEELFNLTSVATRTFSSYHEKAALYAAALGKSLGMHLMTLGAKSILDDVKNLNKK